MKPSVKAAKAWGAIVLAGVGGSLAEAIARETGCDDGWVEPESDWRKKHPGLWSVATRDDGQVVLVSQRGYILGGVTPPGSVLAAVLAYIAACVNAAEAKRGKTCCINCGGELKYGPAYFGSTCRVGPFCDDCHAEVRWYENRS